VDALEALVSKLSVTANKKQDNKKADDKPRNVTEKGILHKAKLLYYQENKASQDVKMMFKENYGEELTVTFKNWTVVKKITDILFDELSSSQQQSYIKKAEAEAAKENK
jgi:hypothetical protein